MGVILPILVLLISMWILNYFRRPLRIQGTIYLVPPGPLRGPEEFIQVRLSEVFPISEDSKVFRFELPDDQALGLPIGQFLKVRANVKTAEKPEGEKIVREYTPTSRLSDQGFFDIPVKLFHKSTNETGTMAQFLDSLKPGDKVEVAGPCGSCQYLGAGEFSIDGHLRKARFIGFLAASAGISPCFQIIQYSATQRSENLYMSLLYSNKTENDILLRPMIEELVAEQQVFVHYLLEKPPDHWKMSSGTLNKEILHEHMPPPGPQTLIFYCGPDSFTSAAQKFLEELGYTDNMMYQFK